MCLYVAPELHVIALPDVTGVDDLVGDLDVDDGDVVDVEGHRAIHGGEDLVGGLAGENLSGKN